MKAVLGLFVILKTLEVIVAQDDETLFDNEQNMDGNGPQDAPNAYPDPEQNPMNNPDQMNYPPDPMYNPDQRNYPPNPMNNPDQMNQPPNQDQMNYPPPPPPQNDEIRCLCGEIAKRTVVKKDTPNKGRGMYVCPRLQNDPERCNFFLWADQAGGGGGQNYGRSNQGGYGRPAKSGYQRRDYNQYPPSGGGNGQPYNQQNQNYGRQMNGPPQQSPNGDIQCNCGSPAKKFVVKKDSPNKGREFFACPKMRDHPNRCNFFLWAS